MEKMIRVIWCVLFTWTLVDHSQQCAAQTYTETDTFTQSYPIENHYLYEAGFTVFGNVKTIAVAAHGETHPTTPSLSVPTIEVYHATYQSPTSDNAYSHLASLDGVNTASTTPGTLATQLGYAIEGGQSVKTSEIIVGTTLYDSAGGLYAAGAGAAYVFKQFSAATWSQQVRLQPSDLTDVNADKFGASVAIDEFNPTRIMVGAPLAATDDTGAVYFFESSPTAKYWTQAQKLMPDTPVANARFGDKVELFGRYAAITEPETCQVYIFEQEKAAPKPKPKVSCGHSPTPSPTPSSWSPLVQHEALRWSQQQVLSFGSVGEDYNCDVGGRTTTFDPVTPADTTTFEPGLNDDDPGYGDGGGDATGGGYGGYLSISMFEDTLAVGVPGYEDPARVRTDYQDRAANPSICQSSCTYNGVGTLSSTAYVPSNRQACCPDFYTCSPTGTISSTETINGGPLTLGHCAEFPYAPGDNGRVYIYDMETFKGDCDRENYFPTVLSFDELVNLRDTGSSDDDDCHNRDDDHHHHYKPKPKPQCEVSRWSMQTSLTSPSPSTTTDRRTDCQNFGYKVDVYKDVVTVNEVNTLSYDLQYPGTDDSPDYELFDGYTDPFPNPTPSPAITGLATALYDEYHCMESLYYPRYGEGTVSPYTDPLVKNGYVYAYEKTSSNTWSHIGGSSPGYEVNTNPQNTGIEAANTQVVGTDIFTMESSAGSYTVDVQSTDTTWQCMVVTLMDQFGDGWGGAELQITDSDGRKQTFAPYCDSPGAVVPFVYEFRWCPDDWEDGSEVKMEILHSPSTKFRWELEWSVYFEWNGEVLYGDWETKMALTYETIGSQVLRLKHAEHLTNTSVPCKQCDLYTAAPSGAPTSKPIHPKPKPKKDPSRVHSHYHSTDSEWLEEEEKDEESESSHLRHLHHKKSVRTHSPTMSPAPTMAQATFSTWEQIALTGTDGSIGWHRIYNDDDYAAANIPMKYFISDKDGKHLYYEGSKCTAETTTTCWNDLPHGDRDYILRVGGASTSVADTTTETWTMCGVSGTKMNQLDFRVKDYISSNINSDECDALLLVDRTVYCQNTLDLVVGASGIIVLEGLTLDTFGKTDLELLGHMVSLIFSPTSLLEVSFVKHMHSSRGAHVGFTIEVPSSTFGLDATDFDTLNKTSAHIVSLLKGTDLSTSMDTLLLELSAMGLESSLDTHGKVYVEDIVTSDVAKTTYVRDPFYFVDDDDDDNDMAGASISDSVSTSSIAQIQIFIQQHTVVFLVVVVVAMAVFVRKRAEDQDRDDFSHLEIREGRKKKSKRESRQGKNGGLLDRHGGGARKDSHNSEDKESKRHKRRDKKKRRETNIDSIDSTLKARVSALKSLAPSGVFSDGDLEGGCDSADNNRTAQTGRRFVPYGSAAELSCEEGWGSGLSAREGKEEGGIGSDEGVVRGGIVLEDDDNDEYGDELDSILSHFESSSESESSDSDEEMA